ncbi:MAG: hypothetical protein PVG30_03350 [Gammaproteobacteria bacterium]|jgi:hypothetical protein
MAKTKCFFRFLNNEDKTIFQQSRCLFTISVGQQTHENEHFEATIELLNKSFKSCIMLVDDSLQRHTMAFNRKQNPDYFYEISIKEGDLWLERNKKYYENLQNLEQIIRWDNWLNHPKFNEQKEAIKKLIEKDKDYAYAFESSVRDFVTKYHNRISNNEKFNLERAKELSFNFILEECTALCLWVELNCNYEAYPNLHNAAINSTREKFVLPTRPDLLNVLTLGFRNAKQLEPQRFLLLENLMGY